MAVILCRFPAPFRAEHDPEIPDLGPRRLSFVFARPALVQVATRWQRIRYLKFFQAVPDIISRIRISIQMTIVGVVVAEFIVGGVGLGHLIQQSTYRGRLGLTFGAVVTIAVGAIILFKITTYLLNRLDPTRRGTTS